MSKYQSAPHVWDIAKWRVFPTKKTHASLCPRHLMGRIHIYIYTYIYIYIYVGIYIYIVSKTYQLVISHSHGQPRLSARSIRNSKKRQNSWSRRSNRSLASEKVRADSNSILLWMRQLEMGYVNYKYICIYIYTNISIYIYIHIYTHTHTYIYIYVYIYIHRIYNPTELELKVKQGAIFTSFHSMILLRRSIVANGM